MNLTTPEKRQIETILNEAETCFSPEDKIDDAVRLLDIQSRQIWDDWDESVANCVIPNDSQEIRNTLQSMQNEITKSELLTSSSDDETIPRKYSSIKTENYLHSKTNSYMTSIDDKIESIRSGRKATNNQNSRNESLLSANSSISKQKGNKFTHRLSTQNTALSDKYKPQRKRENHISNANIGNEHSNAIHSSINKISNANRKSRHATGNSLGYMEVHERNEYNKLRRENLEYAERIRVLRNQLERVNQDNENLRNSLNQSMIERNKQKAKLQYLKNEKLP